MTARSAASGHEVYQSGSDLLISINGRIVLEDLSMLKEKILPRITRGIENVYVDLLDVDYIDSAGLGLLIGFKMQSKSNGAAVALMDPNKTVADVLAISRIDGIFEILQGRTAAEVRDRLVSPVNRLSSDGGAKPGTTDGASAHAPRPQVGVDGSLRLENEDAADQNREAVEDQCRNAVEAMRQGDYERSIQCYKAALELDPEYLPALNNLAIVYEKQPIWRDDAIATWERVLKLSNARNDDKHADRAQRHLSDLQA